MKVSESMSVELMRFLNELTRCFLQEALGEFGKQDTWTPMLLVTSNGTPRATLTLGPSEEKERMECLAFALASEVDHENPRSFERLVGAARYLLQLAFEDPTADFLVVPTSTGPAGRFMSLALVAPGQTDPVVNLGQLIGVLRIAIGKLEQAKVEAAKGPIRC